MKIAVDNLGKKMNIIIDCGSYMFYIQLTHIGQNEPLRFFCAYKIDFFKMVIFSYLSPDRHRMPANLAGSSRYKNYPWTKILKYLILLHHNMKKKLLFAVKKLKPIVVSIKGEGIKSKKLLQPLNLHLNIEFTQNKHFLLKIISSKLRK